MQSILKQNILWSIKILILIKVIDLGITKELISKHDCVADVGPE